MKYIYMKDITRVPRIAQKAYWNESLTRHFAITDGVPCRLWDIDRWLTPISLLIPQMWCKCMNYMNILRNIKEVMHFSENQWLLTSKKIEGLKLMHMYGLHEHNMKNRRVAAFSVKIKIWTQWPKMTPGWHLTP